MEGVADDHGQTTSEGLGPSLNDLPLEVTALKGKMCPGEGQAWK